MAGEGGWEVTPHQNYQGTPQTYTLLQLYFSPAEDCPDYRQFSVDNVNLLIKTYMSEKVKTCLWVCEWFIIQMKGELRLTGYKHHQRVFFHFYDCLPFYFCKNSITKRTGVISFSRFISSWKMLYMADSFQMKHLSRLSQNNIKVRTQLAFVITGKSAPMGFFLLEYKFYSLYVIIYLGEKNATDHCSPKALIFKLSCCFCMSRHSEFQTSEMF